MASARRRETLGTRKELAAEAAPPQFFVHPKTVDEEPGPADDAIEPANEAPLAVPEEETEALVLAGHGACVEAVDFPLEALAIPTARLLVQDDLDGRFHFDILPGRTVSSDCRDTEVNSRQPCAGKGPLTGAALPGKVPAIRTVAGPPPVP